MEREEEIVFQLITHSGAARSDIFEAFQACRNGHYEEAQKLMDSAKENLHAAHRVQTGLIQQEAGGDSIIVKLLMVHAQDHLMTGILAKDIMANMIDMQKEIREIKSQLNR
ncbi:phosphotransferase system lactose/cellobiose-specific iia subunit [Lucifera butyrica]|uniref:Phosphotransferase system lactose/cellobiose-specific iia subunit n=1 Tax=Lucifera butyrica TaxID=1351585 RepID=A0A498RAB5_9FIRM|nr:PTS lactose/cellobiose transporter subunit IIA [Lucifera butyrica]VBB07063.1 phosphotransferase system lactose/cellobiose-specific iia subunit [Lucifera butyrica]